MASFNGIYPTKKAGIAIYNKHPGTLGTISYGIGQLCRQGNLDQLLRLPSEIFSQN